MQTQTDPTEITTMTSEGRKKGILKCGAVSKDNFQSYDIVAFPPEHQQTPVFGLPFTLVLYGGARTDLFSQNIGR